MGAVANLDAGSVHLVEIVRLPHIVLSSIKCRLGDQTHRHATAYGTDQRIGVSSHRDFVHDDVDTGLAPAYGLARALARIKPRCLIATFALL